MAHLTPQEIGKQIAELRKKRNLTQLELARELHTNRSSINMWERGERELKAGDIQLIADYFDVTADRLLYGREAENVDIYRVTGLSQTAIEALKRFNDEDVIYSTDGEAFEQGRCKSLSVALSSQEFLHIVSTLLSIDRGEPGYYNDAVLDRKNQYYECRLSPDMYINLLATRLTLVIDSLRRGEAGKLPDYPPWIRDMQEPISTFIQDHKERGTGNGEERE